MSTVLSAPAPAAGPTGRRLTGNFGPGMLMPGAGKIVQRTQQAVRCGTITGLVVGKTVHPNAKDATKTSTRFLGEFIVVTASGDILQGAECYLPGTVSRVLAAAIDMGQAPVPLSIEVWCEPDPEGRSPSPLGYSYASYNRMPLRANDSLLMLAVETGVIDRPSGLLAGPTAGPTASEREAESYDPETGEVLTDTPHTRSTRKTA